MATIVTRAGKGSPLTNNEVDANFVNLNTDKVEIGGDLSGTPTSPTVSKIQNRVVSSAAPADGDAYVWNAATSTWVPGPAGGGAGTVIGPALSTDNAIVRFDGTTGSLIQNSAATLSDNGSLVATNYTGTYLQLDTVASPPTVVDGNLSWGNTPGTAILGLKGGNVALQVGEQQYIRVYNDSGVNLTLGQVVYINGAQVNRVSVRLAQANSEATSSKTIGLVAESIAVGQEGFVIISGTLNNLNTASLTSGQPIYLSPTVAGGFTATKPVSPNHLVILGWVQRVDSVTGSLYIRVDNGYELDELHNVKITSVSGGQLLSYDQTQGFWKNTSLAAGTGISVNGATNGVITVTNSAPDQTVSLTAGTGITTSGTYPNFTITNSAPDQTVSITAGTGISATGTYPNFTVTNTAPDQVVSITGAGTSVVTGTYPNFTVTSNDQYTGTVTSVGGTGSVNGITLTGSVTSSGNLTLGGTLSNVSLSTQVTGTLPIANGGTGATSTAGAPFALKGANSDITSLTGLTTALSVAQGGTGRNTLTANSVLVGAGTTQVSLVAPGTSGNVLTSNGTAWVSSAPSGGSSYTVRTENYSAVAGDNILADTSGGSFTITLPASPTTGSVISIVDSKGTFRTNPLALNPNGRTINYVSTTTYVSNSGFAFSLVYNGSDWRII